MQQRMNSRKEWNMIWMSKVGRQSTNLYLDREWLKLFNAKLKKLGEKEISYDIFEFVMDQMEKGWFDLVLQSVPHWL